MTLSDRRDHILKGNAQNKLNKGSLAPLKNLTVTELEDELDARGIDIDSGEKLRKKDLQEILTEHLEGMQRPPSIFMAKPTCPTSDINLDNYEVAMFEPLHDIGNLISNVTKELPHHMSDQQTVKEFVRFNEVSLGDKGQIKTSDARLHLVKLALHVEKRYSDGVVSKDIRDIVVSLAEITNICYSFDSHRCSRSILRLYNLTFKVAFLLLRVVGHNIVSQNMSSRRFYGIYFHNMVCHFAHMYRIICLRSLLAEKDECMFGDLQTIAKHTCVPRPEAIIAKCLTKFGARHLLETSKPGSFEQQDSLISREAKKLPPSVCSEFTDEFVRKNQTLWQAHLERLGDYLLLGQGVWWEKTPNGYKFFDVTEDGMPAILLGPPLHHFRSTSLSEEKKYLAECWQSVVGQAEAGTLRVPMQKLKINHGNRSRTIVCNRGKTFNHLT